MSIKAMKQALAALGYYHSGDDYFPASASKAITALRTAIEEAEKQEPVAWNVYVEHGRIYFSVGNQSFPIDYTSEDEPECSVGQAADWYIGQLRHALQRLYQGGMRNE